MFWETINLFIFGWTLFFAGLCNLGFAWALAISLSLYITWSDQRFGICETGGTGDTAIGDTEGGNGTCAYLELKYGHSLAPIINQNCSVDTLPNLCLDALHNFNFTHYEYHYDYESENTIIYGP